MVTVSHNDQIILSGDRARSTSLWHLNLFSPTKVKVIPIPPASTVASLIIPPVNPQCHATVDTTLPGTKNSVTTKVKVNNTIDTPLHQLLTSTLLLPLGPQATPSWSRLRMLHSFRPR